MLREPRTAIAVAAIEGTSSWKWELKVDDKGLYRWYLGGGIETHLRGATYAQAETSLRRFVERSLRGQLQITNVGGRIGADSEQPHSKYLIKGTA